MRPCASRSQPVLTHGYSEKPIFTSLPGVPQMRCLPVWGQRDDALVGQLTLHAARAPGHIAAIDLPVLDYVAPRMHLIYNDLVNRYHYHGGSDVEDSG